MEVAPELAPVAGPRTALTGKAVLGDGDQVVVYAGPSSSSDGSSAEEGDAVGERELSALSNLNLGGSHDRHSYMDEVRRVLFQPSKLRQYMGMDVTSLMSVPLFIMEPFSMLQKMAEIMEYTELLDAANAAEDPFQRIALVAAFLVTPFGAAERTWKPFNPLLGETFEATVGNGVRFMAEQVSHHPPVSAAHAENAAFTYDIVSAPTTKFLGNSLEVYPKGRTRITLRRTGEEFCHMPPNAKVHNLVLGKTWVDSYGKFLVNNLSSGVRVEMDYKPCGWFGAGQYCFEGRVLDAQGVPRGLLSGRWNSHVDYCPCKPDGSAADGAAKQRLWSCAPKPAGDPYGCTYFAWKLNSCELLERPPLPTDSRRRADRHNLQHRHMTVAAAEKSLMEDEQRAEKRTREARRDTWLPKWFAAAPDLAIAPGEESAEAVPLWRWKPGHDWSARPAASSGNWAEEVLGRGFVPWSYRMQPVESAKAIKANAAAAAAAAATGAAAPQPAKAAAGRKGKGKAGKQ